VASLIRRQNKSPPVIGSDDQAGGALRLMLGTYTAAMRSVLVESDPWPAGTVSVCFSSQGGRGGGEGGAGCGVGLLQKTPKHLFGLGPVPGQ
jgi:hypothetical protein